MDTRFPNFLLFGAFFAAEQSYRLIVDANRLFDLGSYGTSLALAAFSREEVGRATILMRNREKLLNSGTVTLKSLRKQLENHVEKLRAALHPVNVHVSQIGIGGIPAPGSQDEKNLAMSLAQLRRIQEKKAPIETHEKKMLGLYVDLSDRGHQWERPVSVDRDDAAGMLISAAIEYQRLRNDLAKLVVQNWSSKPELPEPIWPNWDW